MNMKPACLKKHKTLIFFCFKEAPINRLKKLPLCVITGKIEVFFPRAASLFTLDQLQTYAAYEYSWFITRASQLCPEKQKILELNNVLFAVR